MNILESILQHFEATPKGRLRIEGRIVESSRFVIDRPDLSRPKQLVWWAAQHGLICSVNWQLATVVSYLFEKPQPAAAPPPAAVSAAADTPPCSPETIPAVAEPEPPPAFSSPPASSSPQPIDAAPSGTPHDIPATPPCP